MFKLMKKARRGCLLIAAGAAGAYLMDPDRGEQRRRDLRNRANGLKGQARQEVEHAQKSANTVVAQAGDAVDQAKDLIGSATKRAKEVGADAAGTAQHAKDEVSALGDEAAKRAEEVTSGD